MHELPLVFFTVLCQSAVGAFIILFISYRLSHISERRLAVGFLVVMLLFIVGVLLGTFHIGRPLRALNMLFGIGRSPMSNEIALSALFGLFGCLATLGMLLKKGSVKLHQILAIVAILFGVAFIVAVPSIYQLATVAAWNTPFTSLFMILTAFIGGGALAALLGASRLGLSLSCLAIVASLAIRANYMGMLFMANSSQAIAQNSWFNVQAILMVLILLLGMLVLVRRPNSRALLATCASLALVSELLGRIAFYNLWAVAM